MTDLNNSMKWMLMIFLHIKLTEAYKKSFANEIKCEWVND